MRVYKALIGLAVLPGAVLAYPKLLLSEKKCGKALLEGTKIMGHQAVQSKDKIVTVTRGDTKLDTGAPYKAGETLKISFEPGDEKAMYVFETMGGEFKEGKCANAKRMIPNDDGFAEFVAPEDGFDVLIWAGFASKKDTVTITQAFVLSGEKGERKEATNATPPRAAIAAAAPAAAAPAAGDDGKEELVARAGNPGGLRV